MYLNVIQLNAGAGSKNNGMTYMLIFTVPLIWITRTCAKSLQKAHIKQAKNGKHRVQTRKIQAKHYTNIEYDIFGFKEMRCIITFPLRHTCSY